MNASTFLEYARKPRSLARLLARGKRASLRDHWD